MEGAGLGHGVRLCGSTRGFMLGDQNDDLVKGMAWGAGGDVRNGGLNLSEMGDCSLWEGGARVLLAMRSR